MPQATKAPPVWAAKIFLGLIDAADRLQRWIMPAPAMLLKLTSGGAITSRVVYVAAELGLADLLSSGPRNVAELAAATGTDEDALYRVLRALASIDIFAEATPRVFRITPLGNCLRSDVPGSMRAWVRYLGSDWHHALWGATLDAVRTGKSASQTIHGLPFFDWLDAHPDAERHFGEGMTNLSAIANPAIASAYDFSAIGKLVDVAGGRGSLLAAILEVNPHLRGTLFDLPTVIAEARDEPTLRAPNIAARLTFTEGSFFEAVPEGGDAYLLKWILHDWQDADAHLILTNCRRAMALGARLLLVEMVIPPGNQPTFGKFLDVSMLVIVGGRERTRTEYDQLLAANAFQLTRVLPTALPYRIVEGIAV